MRASVVFNPAGADFLWGYCRPLSRSAAELWSAPLAKSVKTIASCERRVRDEYRTPSLKNRGPSGIQP